jgi:hypothetical protein
MKSDYITPTHLAARWYITTHTLDQWRWNGNGPRFHKFGRKILYHIDDIQKFEAGKAHYNTMYIKGEFNNDDDEDLI